ncbi:MAG: hypothetical protein OSB26_14770 [Woeseiaceae bacterium]|nr:hypothetical protein [Woeseiaceae bacterium]
MAYRGSNRLTLLIDAPGEIDGWMITKGYIPAAEVAALSIT